MAIVIAGFLHQIFVEIEEEERERKERFLELKLQRRYLRDTANPFTLPPHFFRLYYRMTPEVTTRLIELVEARLMPQKDHGIPPHLQVLITLRFLAEGALQKGFCQDYCHPIGQSTASRCITRVINAINTLASRFVQFPTTPQKRQHIQRGFRRTIRIPGVIGLVDCFLVSFQRPSQNEEAFFNYHRGTSMNVQIITDADYYILNIRICPGRNNDRYIWQYSQAKDYMESLRQNENILEQEGCYYILGDSGYTPSPILLTPDLEAEEGSPAYNYTTEHVRTRCKVEQTIGILTNVWRAIKRARTLYYTPEKVGSIINACAILHNFRRLYGVIDDDIDDFNVILDNHAERQNDYPLGIQERNRLINEYY